METQDSGDKHIKQLIWLYFWLLIFEGALRKWIVPSLSTPLLIVRDPVVILIYVAALSRNKFSRSAFIPWIFILAFFSLLASFAGSGNFNVTLYGLRTDFLHLPLIFVIGEIFTPADVKKIGKWVLILSVPMAILALQQFRSSPDARINAGAGGEIGAQLFASSGKIRPAGTFSFVTGMVCFLSLTAAFVLFDFLQKKQYHRFLSFSSMIALGLSLGVSGSRSAVLTVSLVLSAALLACWLKKSFFGSALKPLLFAYILFLVLSLLPIFRQGIAIQQERFEGSGGLREGIFERFYDDLATSFSAAPTVPLCGYGLGVGTNAGAGILVGYSGFLLAEGEWSRVVMESGPILGFAFIGLRAAILIYLIRRAGNALNRRAVLPILLLGMVGLDLITGQFSQPTAMGFIILGSGLCLAAAREEELMMDETPADTLPSTQRIMGRSRYAEALHGKS